MTPVRFDIALIRIGAILMAGGVLLPWVTTPDSDQQSASGLDVAAGVFLWHQPGLYVLLPYGAVVLLLAGIVTHQRRVGWLLLTFSLLPWWECVSFLQEKVPFGDSSPQSLLGGGFGEYFPGAGVWVSLVGSACLAIGVVLLLAHTLPLPDGQVW